MKKRLEDQFGQFKHRLRLNSTKKRTVTNVICVFPEVATKAFTKRKGQKGFLRNGNLDRKHKIVPVMSEILGTCKRKIPKEVFDLFMNNIQYLFDTMEEKGEITEGIWDKIGIPKDVAPDGSVFERDAGVSQENQMRARILTHAEVKKAREARHEEIDEAARLKKSRDDKKHADTLATDAATVASLRQHLKNRDESAEQDLCHCTKEDFSKINAPELREFIFYRSDKFKTKSELKKVTKGNLADANQEPEGGRDNKLISVEFELRCAECKLLEESGNLPEEATNDTVETLVIPVAMDPTVDWKSPHNILSRPGWIEHVNSIFNSGNTLIVSDVNEEVKSRAAALARTLLRRFEYHLSKRVLVEYKRSHPILKWFRKNIPAFAAYMVLFNHVKKNTSNLSDMDCLLTNSMNNFLLLNSNNGNLWGAYLVHDGREEKHVRSGKCTGRGMVERWGEHHKNASSDMNSNSSKFGDTYPSRNSARASGINGRCFEDLNQYAAAAFEPTDTAFDLFQKDFDSGGLFCWAPSEKDIVCRTKISGCSNDGHKFAAVVAYGFEMCYDIAISRRDNLSESPGFEAFGLMHGG